MLTLQFFRLTCGNSVKCAVGDLLVLRHMAKKLFQVETLQDHQDLLLPHPVVG